MPDSPPQRRPSDQVDELREQLLRELERLEKRENGEEPELFRAYLQHAQVLAWRAVAEGRMSAPRAILDALRAAEPFVYRRLPGLPDLAASAALEVHFTLRSLQLAVEALEERQVEERLADERSETEREILHVLFEHRGKYLRRGAIHKRLELSNPPTAPRVGQILAELHHQGLLLRIHGRAQGNPNAAFYALSPHGLEVCHRLFEEGSEEEPAADVPQVAAPQDLERITQAATIALDPGQSKEGREIVTFMLANKSIGPLGPQILETLERVAHENSTDEVQKLYRTVFLEVQSARRNVVTAGKGWTVEPPAVKEPGTFVFDPMSQQETTALQEARKRERAAELVEV